MDENKLNTLMAKFEMDAQKFKNPFRFKRDGLILRGTVQPDVWSPLIKAVLIGGTGGVVTLLGILLPIFTYIGLAMLGVAGVIVFAYPITAIIKASSQQDNFIVDLSTGKWTSTNDAYFSEVKKWFDINLSLFSADQKVG